MKTLLGIYLLFVVLIYLIVSTVGVNFTIKEKIELCGELMVIMAVIIIGGALIISGNGGM